MSRLGTISRRLFLGFAAVAAGGVAVGYYYYKRPHENPLEDMLAEGEATFNPWIKIAADNTITVIAPRAEMGQGIQTTLAALVAEELDVDPSQLVVEHGPAAPAYYNGAMFAAGGPFPWYDESFGAKATAVGMGVVAKFLSVQVTGGSSATIDAYEKMRGAGCGARELIKLAAANRWGVEASRLTTAGGIVTNPADGAELTYGALALEAAELDPPRMELRPQSDWKYLGKPVDRAEGIEKVTGGRIFGIDVELPDMLHGTVKMCPRFGSGAISHDPAPALAIPGVIAVHPIETITGKGFGIIAENTWAAFQGAEALEVAWEEASYPKDEDGMAALFAETLANGAAFERGGAGDVEAAFAAADPGDVHDVAYDVPFLAHTTMEPMNATAQMQDGKLTIWTGTQAPGLVQMIVSGQLDMDGEDVTVHTTFLGGGFGRRAETDFALYAASLAQHTDGRPIKVTWTREEDTRHDMYRPRVSARARAVVMDGKVEALDFRAAGVPIMKSVMGRSFPSMSPPDDEPLLDGLFNQPFETPNRRFEGVAVDMPVPVGFWRSVGNTQNGFFHEVFIDELAEKAGLDPIDFRLAHMTADEMAPARAVLEKVREMSDWDAPTEPGRAKGVAFMLSFGTWVAEVVEVIETEDGVKIAKVWCAADCGTVLDPRNFEAQMISGIIYGLSATQDQAITFEDGEVVQENFYDFDALRQHQAPEIEVAILETAPKMGGAGEPGTPPAAPALANALYRLTGQRLRSMPFGEAVAFV